MSSPFLTRFAPVALLPGVWCACAGIPIGIFVLAPPLVSKVLATMYSCWYLYDFRKPFTGGWALQFFRRLKWWDLCREYFPYELHLEDGVAEELKLKASKKEVVIFCTHPHGVLCAGLFLTFGFNTEGSLSRKVPDLVWRVMTIKATFFVPLWREFTEALGFIDASRSSASKTLKRGMSCVVVPGGAAEAMLGGHYHPELILHKRKGFCKLALQHDADLVPCFTFGENELFDHVDASGWGIVGKVRRVMKSALGVTVPLLKNVTPKKTPLNTVIGPAVRIKDLKETGEKERVEELHGLYVKGLEELYERHRDKFGYRALKIVE